MVLQVKHTIARLKPQDTVSISSTSTVYLIWKLYWSKEWKLRLFDISFSIYNRVMEIMKKFPICAPALWKRFQPRLTPKSPAHVSLLFEMQSGECVSFDHDHGLITLQCLTGKLWVTQQNDRQDYKISAGEHIEITKQGRVVAQALLNATWTMRNKEAKAGDANILE